MGTRRTRIKTRSEGGLGGRGGLALLRRARGDDRAQQPPPAARPAPEEPAPSDAPPRQAAAEEPYDERRWREAGGPEDVAQYTCTCGFVFDAPVSASVSCPHCGSAQAW